MKNKAAWVQALVKGLNPVLFFCAVGLSSCGRHEPKQTDRAGIDPRPEAAAPRAVNESFHVKSPQRLNDLGISANGYQVMISSQALNKEFLLQATIASQAVVATDYSLKSRGGSLLISMPACLRLLRSMIGMHKMKVGVHIIL